MKRKGERKRRGEYRVSRNNGVNDICIYPFATWCEGRRVAVNRQTNRWTDGDAAGNYVTRTERPRNRNFCPPFLSFPFSFLLFHVYYPFYYPFGASGSRCLSFCPLANAGQLPVPIVFCFNGRSLPRIRFRETDSHVSGEHR